jgi:hypothetical protein
VIEALHSASHSNKPEGARREAVVRYLTASCSIGINVACQRVYSLSGWLGSDLRQKFGPGHFNVTGVSFLKSREALIGTRVRVLEGDRRPELRGKLGTIEHRYGHPEYVALDVRLDDGRLELFWAHGLERAD